MSFTYACKKSIVFLFLLILSTGFSQTKISGKVVDEEGNPIPFSNIIFVNSNIGAVSDEEGKFYLESDQNHTEIEVSFLGFKTKRLKVSNRQFNLNILLENESSSIGEVLIYSGRVKHKGNPAVDLLRKIWEMKKKNGLKNYDYYQFKRYEKVEFDINNIDSAFIKKRLFKGMEFIFNNIDTSKFTGKAFLPIFINEALYNVYGKNKKGDRIKEDLIANKTSGFEENQNFNVFLKELYQDYNIYDNFIRLFNKNFVSPLSKVAGLLSYNYVLRDSAYIDNKWCYNIIYYPRRKNELTFKGDFWVNDTTYAIKNINMQVVKSANVNWVDEIYLEQDFEVVNDSTFLLKKDYIMSNFSINKKEKSRGVYGKRTSLFSDYQFGKKREDAFYEKKVNAFDESIYTKTDTFWKQNRLEKLSKKEKNIYKLLDTLQNVKRFKQATNLASILASGYVEINNFDFGPIFSTIGKNNIEGTRLRVGGRTYFGRNDLWRIQGYTAYGFKDHKMKFGISGKWMIYPQKRIIIGGGARHDIEQTGVGLTTTTDVLGRSFASSSFFSRGDDSKLSNIKLYSFYTSIEPKKNVAFTLRYSQRELSSASPTFNLDYWLDKKNDIKATKLEQSEVSLEMLYTPKKKTIGYGVERRASNGKFPTIYLKYSNGFKNERSDFNYHKLQFFYRQPFFIGGLGRLNSTLELGKTYGEIPLGLMSVIPGNQSYFLIKNTFSLLNYYEFVSDTYASLRLEHNFSGRFFSKIPLLKKMNLREIVGFKAAWGSVTDANERLNASSINYVAPTKPYYEYSVGVGNIFKVFRIDFTWKGNYKNLPDSNDFMIKGAFGFTF